MLRRTGFKPSTSTLKQTGFKSAAHARIAAKETGAVAKLRAAGQREAKTKPAKSAARTTAAERAYLGIVASMGCCLCQHLGLGSTPAEVHHVRARHGWGRSGHFATIPLCPTHHRGQPGGVHDMGRAQFAAHYGISEIQLLEAVTLQITNSKTPVDCESAGASKQNPREEIYA